MDFVEVRALQRASNGLKSHAAGLEDLPSDQE
jgi:hypothetical protein